MGVPYSLPIVNGLPSPLSPDQLSAAGVAPYRIQLPAPGVPAATGTPFGQGISDPYAAVRQPIGAPQAGPPIALQNLATGQDAERKALASMTPTEQSAYNAAEASGLTANPAMQAFAKRQETARAAELPSAAPAAPAKLIPTVADTQQKAGKPGDPGQDLAAQWAMRHAGGTGPRRLAEQGETQKYTQYGTVPAALNQDIAAKQEAVDKAQAAGFQEVATDNADALSRQRDVIAQQQADAQRAEAQRQAVNERISELQAHSDAQEAALIQAKPKQATEFFGGNQGASILAALATALGSAKQGLVGGNNPGADIVNGAIDRWVNDQRQQYEMAKDKATLANNKFKDALQVFGTPEAAESSIRLQALAAKNALAQNMADQSKNQEWLMNAQLMQQDDQLKRQQLRAAQIQQAGMREVEAKLTETGGAGSGKNPYLAGAQAAAEYRAATRTASDTTNEDRKTDIEERKAVAAGNVIAKTATEAADAITRYADKAASVSDRASPQGKGEVADAREEAVNKYAAHLIASREASQRNARQAAEDYLASRGDVARGLSADVALRARAKTLRGDSIRATGAYAAGLDPTQSGDVGSPE